MQDGDDGCGKLMLACGTGNTARKLTWSRLSAAWTQDPRRWWLRPTFAAAVGGWNGGWRRCGAVVGQETTATASSR